MEGDSKLLWVVSGTAICSNHLLELLNSLIGIVSPRNSASGVTQLYS